MSNELENKNNHLFPKPNEPMGYKIPKNYFEGIEAGIFTRLSEENFSKTLDFDIPEGYFDTIEDTILNKIESSKKGKVITLKSRILKFAPVAVAASLILFFSIHFFNNNQSNTTANNLLAGDIEEWFNDSLDFNYSNELALVFEDEFDLSENDIIFNDDLIEDYFENVSDIDLLNEIE